MMWRTHALTGISSLWLLLFFPSLLNTGRFPFLVAIAAFGALVPDLDAAESKIKHLRIGRVKPFSPLSFILHRTLGHRGLLHSLLGLSLIVVLSLYLTFWWGWLPSAALVLGYASHLAADAATRSGIPLLYPNPKRYYLLPRRWRFVTGSLAEEILFPFLALVVAVLLLRVAMASLDSLTLNLPSVNLLSLWGLS